MRAVVYCPTGCGSKSFRAARSGVLVEDFDIDAETGEMVNRHQLAEAGGRLMLSCTECGHHWRSRRDLDVAYFMDGL